MDCVIIILFIFLAFFSNSISSLSPCSNQSIPLDSSEFLALQSFYDSTSGSNWKWDPNEIPWNFSSLQTPLTNDDLLRPCGSNISWGGIQCLTGPNSTCYISEINLPSHNLQNQLSSVFLLFPKLRLLNLFSNSLSGPLFFAFPSNLQTLNLGKNLFKGRIHSNFLTNLTSLLSLSLTSNSLSGLIPSELGYLSSLITLDLSLNRLSGPLPTSLRNLSSLSFINLNSNHLNGSLPSFLFSSLPGLLSLQMNKNHFSGPLPPLSPLLTPNLSLLSLTYNSLSGPVPSSFCGFSRLSTLDFTFNALTSTVPACLCAPNQTLTSLTFLDFTVNHMTGSAPSTFFSGCPGLTHLSLAENTFTGRIPTLLGDLSRLQYLALGFNHFSHSLPSALGSFTNLQLLTLVLNWFSGDLADFLPSLLNNSGTKNTLISMRNNYFTGSLPTNIGNAIKIGVFYASTNLLTGPIPSTLHLCTSLSKLQLQLNFLTGPIPSSLNSLPLTLLSLSSNFLTGTIPPALGFSPKMVLLDLHQNDLIGPLPSSFAHLTSIEELILHDNSLSGTLPPYLFRYHRLIVLSLSSNCFSGSLPACLAPLQTNSSSLLNTYSPSIQVLNLNGLTSGLRCRTYPFKSRSTSSPEHQADFSVPPQTQPSSSSSSSSGSSLFSSLHPGYVSHRFLSGPLPSCLWSLPSLHALYLSGNGLSGQLNLPPSLTLTANLVNLSLSFNRFTGPLPLSLQTRGSFQWMDVSQNRLGGTLSSHFSLPELSDQTSVNYHLSTNRLSGQLPAAFNLVSFSREFLIDRVLTSNLFSFQPSSLASHSPEDALVLQSYEGSSVLNIGISLCLASMVLTLLISSLYLRFELFSFNSRQLSYRLAQFLKLFKRWGNHRTFHPRILFVTDQQREESDSLARIGGYTLKFLTFSTRLSLFALFFSCVVILSLKLSPTSLASTVVSQQAWVLSSAYLAGFPSAILFKVLLTVSLGLLILFVAYNNHSTLTATKPDLFSSPYLDYLLAPYRALCSFIRSVSDLLSPDWRLATLFICGMFLVDVLVVLLINFLYLQTILTQNSVLYPIFFGFFKSLWSSAIIPMTLRGVHRIVSPSIAIPETFLLWIALIFSIFNIILAPCLATVLSDSACLLSLFEQQSLPPLDFSYIICARFNQDGSCVNNSTIYFMGQPSQPSFVYNFSCGSALIVQYSPLILYSVLLSGFVFPFTYLLALFLIHLEVLSEEVQGYCEWLLPLLRVPLGRNASILRHLLASHAHSQARPSSLARLSSRTSSLRATSSVPPTRLLSSEIGISLVALSSPPPSPPSSDTPINPLHRSSLPIHNASSPLSSLPQPFVDSPAALGSGFGVVLSGLSLTYRPLIHLTLLLTFGLACPYVGILAAFGVYFESRMLIVLLGRRRHLSERQERAVGKQLQAFLSPSQTQISQRRSKDIERVLGNRSPASEEDRNETRQSESDSNSKSELGESNIPRSNIGDELEDESDFRLSFSPSLASESASLYAQSPSPSLFSFLRQFFILIVDPDVFFLSDYAQSRPSSSRPSSTRPSSFRPSEFRDFERNLPSLPALSSLPSLSAYSSSHNLSTDSSASSTSPSSSSPYPPPLSLGPPSLPWSSVRGYVWLLALTAEAFWLVQILDMIADREGVLAGVYYSVLWLALSLIVLYVSSLLSLFLVFFSSPTSPSSLPPSPLANL